MRYVLLCFFALVCTHDGIERELNRFNDEYAFMSWVLQSLDWQYSNNLTDGNSKGLSDFHQAHSQWMRKWKEWANEARKTRSLTTVQDRMLSLMTSGVVCEDPDDSRLLSVIKSNLTKIYESGTIYLEESGRTLRGAEEVNQFMASLRDPILLRKVWLSWQDRVGRKVREPFSDMVHLLNKCARENGYDDYGAVWRSELEMNDVAEEARQLWDSVRQFYHLLLDHTKRRLRLAYGPGYVNSTTIPVHLLGSLWGYNWENLKDILLPFPNVPLPRSTYEPEEVLPIAQKVYISMGMPLLPQSFWEKSLFRKPRGNDPVECHGSAYDFSLHNDFRMRACLNGSSSDLGMVIHEMGHIMYFMAYHHQPMVFRTSPISAFHEALGDSISDGVTSPWCFKTKPRGYKEELNYLMQQALSKVAILPWALTIDLWRYKVFSGEIEEKDFNREWWKMRELYQGVHAPKIGEDDFDPGTKFHVIKAMPYMRYFFGSFLRYQFLEAMCKSDQVNNGQTLSHCCLIGSRNAGKKIWDMMSKGASLPWKTTLKSLTGIEQISSQPLLRYYQLLIDWLKRQV